MNSFLSGFLNPLSCHALFAEKVHPSRDALIRCGTTSWANAANLVTLPWRGVFGAVQQHDKLKFEGKKGGKGIDLTLHKMI